MYGDVNAHHAIRWSDHEPPLLAEYVQEAMRVAAYLKATANRDKFNRSKLLMTSDPEHLSIRAKSVPLGKHRDAGMWRCNIKSIVGRIIQRKDCDNSDATDADEDSDGDESSAAEDGSLGREPAHPGGRLLRLTSKRKDDFRAFAKQLLSGKRVTPDADQTAILRSLDDARWDTAMGTTLHIVRNPDAWGSFELICSVISFSWTSSSQRPLDFRCSGFFVPSFLGIS